jgi:hypothetical protein
VRHIDIAAGRDHHDDILIHKADLPNQFVLSARKLKRPIGALAFGLGIETHAHDHCIGFRS